MKQINQSIIEGYLIKEPDIAFVGNKKTTLCKMFISYYSNQVKNNKSIKEHHIFKIIAWGKLGENCNRYLKKGSRIIVHGRMKQNLWETRDKKDKNNFFIEAININFLSPFSKNEK